MRHITLTEAEALALQNVLTNLMETDEQGNPKWWLGSQFAESYLSADSHKAQLGKVRTKLLAAERVQQ